ncbi:GIY-YIG nuclease family protein [uncultured Microbulbifer sp.]|uniref:GIY-YIG nuclease family protein n=1 Tax=uncultured Microbulbifer sp. TaxID=348147 RepID=UPI0025DE51F8|nr:GIY-YIG nuclease family protein [uncultured Microbulbifer sp.]
MKTKTQLAAEARQSGRKFFAATCRRHGANSQHYVSAVMCKQCVSEQTKRYYSTPKGKAAAARQTAKRFGNEVDRYVYLMKCEIAGLAYIGSTTMAPSRRRIDNFNKLRSGSHHNPALQAAFDEHGEKSFSFEMLAHFPGQPEETLRQYEQFYLDAGEVRGLRLVNVKRASVAAPQR